MGQAEPIKTHYSYEEYLALEQQEGIRYEYFHGEVFAMAGGTKRHNRISKNIINAIDRLLNNDCESYIGDVKVKILHLLHYVYPDVVVTCDPKDLEDDQEASIQNPTLVIEVLSKSTQNYDLEQKKDAYMRIPTLEYYMMVSQEDCLVKMYERQPNFWAYTFYDEPTQSVSLPNLNLTLPISEIYKRVNFEADKDA